MESAPRPLADVESERVALIQRLAELRQHIASIGTKEARRQGLIRKLLNDEARAKSLREEVKLARRRAAEAAEEARKPWHSEKDAIAERGILFRIARAARLFELGAASLDDLHAALTHLDTARPGWDTDLLLKVGITPKLPPPRITFEVVAEWVSRRRAAFSVRDAADHLDALADPVARHVEALVQAGEVTRLKPGVYIPSKYARQGFGAEDDVA